MYATDAKKGGEKSSGDEIRVVVACHTRSITNDRYSPQDQLTTMFAASLGREAKVKQH